MKPQSHPLGLLRIALLFVALATAASAQVAYLGAYRAGKGAAYLSDLRSFDAFSDHYRKMNKKGLRLVDFRHVGGRSPKFIGSYQAGGGKTFLSRLFSFSAFVAHYKKMNADGLRLVDFEVYRDGKRLNYIGVYRSGSGRAFLSKHESYKAFVAHYEKLFAKGLRLIEFDTFETGGKRLYVGVFHQGKGGNILAKTRTYAEFSKNHAKQLAKNLRLVDFEYFTTGKARHYVGVYRSGKGTSSIGRLDTFSDFAADYSKKVKRGLRLVDVELVPRPDWWGKKRINAVSAKYRKDNKVTGMTVAVAERGRIVYCQGFGWRDVAKKRKAGVDDVYRIASISKAVTGSMAMRLVGQGKLDLDRDIRRYVPSFPKKTQGTMTLRQILSHQSGIRHYRSGNDPTKNVSKFFPTCQSALSLFRGDALLHRPGTKYDYSTHAFTLAGAAIESATKRSFAAYAGALFKKLGLKTLRVDSPKLKMPGRSQLYGARSTQAVARDDLSWKAPGGGMISSAPDLVRFGLLNARGKVVPKRLLESMWTGQKLANGRSTSAGLGWSVGNENGRRVVAHSGSQRGAASYLRVYPDDGMVVAVLSNSRGHSPRELAKTIAQIVLGEPRN